ncbi:MAG TPA: hypothetical protein VEZ55_08785, partial [Chitinophagaceae bacterium]|nr:hypothetical protein [Chitinophagaceae bacterium]
RLHDGQSILSHYQTSYRCYFPVLSRYQLANDGSFHKYALLPLEALHNFPVEIKRYICAANR